jgi:hypothetical protein
MNNSVQPEAHQSNGNNQVKDYSDINLHLIPAHQTSKSIDYSAEFHLICHFLFCKDSEKGEVLQA